MNWPNDLFTNLDDYPWLKFDTATPWRPLDDIGRVVNFLSDHPPGPLHPTASVHPSAVITNSYIGKNVQVYEGCTIRDSIIWDETVVGHGSEIARSIILKSCFIPRFNYVGGSLLGERVQLGGVVALATRRHDNKAISISWGQEKILTPLHKLGSIIGEDVIIAFGSHVNPGTVIGRGTIIMPHIDLRGFIPPQSIVYVKQQVVITGRRPFSIIENDEDSL